MKGNIVNNRMRVAWLGAGMALLLLGCSGDDAGSEWTDLRRSGPVVHRLRGFSNTADFEVYAKESASDYMKAQVELNRKGELYVDSQMRVDAPTAGNDMVMDGDMAGGDAAAPGASNEGAEGGGGGDREYSSTNVQEEGVDEADVVKTDGGHIYVLHAGELVIVEVADGGLLTKVGALDVGGYALEMFVAGDTAVIFSNVDVSTVPDEMRYRYNETPANPSTRWNDYYDYPEPDWDMSRPDDGGAEPGWAGVDTDEAGVDPMLPEEEWEERGDEAPMPYPGTGTGNPCSAWGCSGNESYVQMAIVDMTDRSAPAMVRMVTYAGSYVTSRMIDGMVRAVIDTQVPKLEMVWDYGTKQDWDSEKGINDIYTHMVSVNEAYFASLTIDDFLPRKYDSATDTVDFIVSPDIISGPETPNGIGLQTVISVDMRDPSAAPSASAVFAERGLVYASADSLYLTSSRNWVSLAMESGLWDSGGNSTTGIHKFDISVRDSGAAYLATGEIQGRLLNQFSMGEKDGYLRVAATSGDFWDRENIDNHVYVLERSGNTLEIVGQLSGLGKPGEEIYAARFIGNRGFVVTFEQIDPFYTLDMTDPTNPTIVGEWEGPGFSTYLHPWGDDYMISVGEENWQFAISLFDISDFADPQLASRHLYENNEYSSAVYEHKAFIFNPGTGYLALPFSGWTYDNDYSGSYQTGIRTFAVTEDGILPVADMNFYQDQQSTQEPDAIRSLWIEDMMYGMSRCRLVAAPIADPSAVVQSAPLFDGVTCADSTYYYNWW